ncbi:MAG: ATP-dependent DNA helicase RecG [Candidatus Portnoybacteria bacterium RBG_19FT_COMBO_36_7]|uniref:ATP-dependent DNA helicase RecG n=1 Tax=Candidatus Portnoybacteria bacterium RBG_19FT_COMBO_36_7 TaxID=1801992 RepID=A0A1G2F8P1_9BACT|nr:MAG: ATP-dependent DNA helicase RecG [Candidatus Portnoybacteria bacterium RBG_19FT_COMBO_36_7]
MNLDSPIQSISRLTPTYQKRLLKLGIKNLRDIFYHFPFRYEDFSKIKPIGELKLNETATIQGQITEIKNIKTWKKRMYITEAYIQDKTGVIKAIWFNQPYLTDTLKTGQTVSLSGKISFDKTLCLSNPAYEKMQKHGQLCHTGRLVAVYPETKGISSRWLRYIIKMLLPKFLSQIKDYLPLEIKKSQGLLDLSRAIEQIHFPKTIKHSEAARKRLVFDELFLIQLFVLQQKMKWRKNIAPNISFDQTLIKNFVESFPFKLTDAQRRSAWEILQDLDKSKPMNRLLEGDVGSGKTVVAAIAMLQATKAGWQAALMAPTEILAQQHFRELTKILINLDLSIGLLTGTETMAFSASEFKTTKKEDLLKDISTGKIQIVVGTHALIQKTVNFKKLALVVVDEQHRFGVAQRAALQKNIKKIEDGLTQTIPHLLSMTATPIPRTLALTIYGDLDISLLDELPKGRQEIITKIVAPIQRQQAYEFIRRQIKEGRQVFVICPRIEVSDKLQTENNNEPHLMINDNRSWDDVKAVKEEYEKLHKIIFPDLRINMLHGKLKSKEKEKTMLDFKNGKTDILVSTSVVEVGVDVPNATVIMIEGADRFGLAQLHQFRGRVGRGTHQSYCFLFSESSAKNTNARLKAIINCKNGFELAEKDLEIRGPGHFYGNQQWGLPDLSMASLADVALVKNVRQEAQKLITKDPELTAYPMLCEKIRQFQKDIHLE